MRIAIVTGEYPPMVGGIADYTANLAEALRRAGDEVVVVTDERAVRQPTGSTTVVAAAGWSFVDLPALRRQIIDIAPDVVHIEYQTAAFKLGGAINLLPATLGAIPTVVTFHDTREPYLFPKAGPLRRLANVRLAQDAAAVICTNAEDARTVRQYGAKRAHVIPLGNNVAPAQEPDRRRWRDRLGL
ncbi:MAG: glycosyltransferase, partial [Dehalococcoidia bacterium]|nr:glycosyltransferase [Dehalococcoidia bacterium]